MAEPARDPRKSRPAGKGKRPGGARKAKGGKGRRGPKGAGAPVGGHRLADGDFANGHFFAPTLLTGITEDMTIYREETFGPVAPVIGYSDVDDVLNLANDTNYGLAAYVYTQDLSTAIKAFEGLRFGIIGVNDVNPTAMILISTHW